MTTMVCNPLFLKGNCHSIPMSELDKAFDIIITLIQNKNINTVCWDGDPLTLVHPHSNTGLPVKSFTLLIPRIYEWACQNNTFIRFIYTKKEKSITNLLNNGPTNTDKHGTYYGPFYFLSNSNTRIIRSDEKTENVFHYDNIAISASNDLKWNAIGINMIKWFKKHGVHSGYLLVIGRGDVVNSELKRLSDDEIICDIPVLETRILEFERDSIP